MLWGIDIAVDAGLRPFVLEVNTAPELTYGDKQPRWQGVVDRMLDDFVEHFVMPGLNVQENESADPKNFHGGWLRCASACQSSAGNYAAVLPVTSSVVPSD